ncbi:hypothetical protein J5N97_004705, partial [Dioscorea zingiberensis]
SLMENRISGKIPKELGHITTLQELVLQDNMLEGTIPTSLGNLVNLEKLHLSGNYFTGELPELLANLKNLIDLRIDGNPISGKIPPFMGNWKKLNILQMQGTSLEGPFPSNFSALEALTELMVSPLERGDGQFPPLWNMKNLKRLVLRNISLCGELPDYLGNMKKLKTLDLSFNNLTGKIPENFSSLKKTLKFLFLTNNRLTGKIPNWILESDNCYYDLSYNSFDDASAPEQCYRGVNLVSSYSTSNNTKIPTCFRWNHPCSGMAKNSKLFINCGGSEVTIGGNVYQEDPETEGPSYYKASGKNWAFSSTGYFVRKEEGKHIVSTNMSVFNMPDSELYKTARLSPLSLKYYGLCLQNGNYTVNLHFAEIMFTDDQTFSSLGRRFFDVSIQGRKVLQNFNIVKEANGIGLPIKKSYTASVTSNTLQIHFCRISCGQRWPERGTTAIPHKSVYGPLISAISVTSDFEDSKLSTGAILGIVVAACGLIALMSTFIWFCLRRKIAENNELQGLELQTGYFTLRQIKAATSNFDPANKIGEGGFGPVYKGVLPDGSVIAVKQLSSKSKQGNREFINEIGMISALHHPNLVKLFGCCIEENQLLLVYEYMENNSLASALFGPERDRLKLDWQTRHRICLSIARGLVYLHEESRLKIVHRDIKATNVLLDKDLNAKISDFGLARLSDEDESHISTRIAGTIGYMAPEYAMRGYLTDKADVYSFGVVILEIVSGVSNGKYQLKDNHVYRLGLHPTRAGSLLGTWDLGEHTRGASVNITTLNVLYVRRDLSFNFLTGRIPDSYIRLQSHIDFIYLTNNNLTGAIPDWILNTRKQHIDISYNSFNGSNAPPDCHRGSNLNVVSSYSSTNDNRFAPCLRRNNPCPGIAKYYNLFINCGGPAWTIGEDEYQGDMDTEVNLHFAEIMFNNDQTYFSIGRRFFDASIQGKKVLRDFNIEKEAKGTGQAIVKSFTANNFKGVELLTGYFTLRQIKAATRNFDAAKQAGRRWFWGQFIKNKVSGGIHGPEYAMRRGYLTDKADVYSFGVVMLEIVSGLSNTHLYKTSDDFIYLLDWGRSELLELVDKNLGSNYPQEEALQLLNLALTCTNSSPSLRPTMSTVVSILDGKSPVSIPSVKPTTSSSDVTRFSSSLSMDGPCGGAEEDRGEVGEAMGLHSGSMQWDLRLGGPQLNKDLVVNVTCGACNATSCHVTSVVLKGQNLTGSLPDEFSNLTSLQVIDLTRNYLNGTIPAAWASLPLTNLTLLGNRITGTIPDEFGNIITLLAVSLEDNLIEGPLPQSLGKLVNLDRLHLSANNISGQLPESLGNLNNLTEFRIDGNPVTGKIPSFMGNWKKISRIDMQGTSMEGPFPSNFSALTTLSELRVTDLKGFGKFPPLQNMGGMIRLILRNLSISGELPDYIGDMGNLKTLDLSFNNLTGPIPSNYEKLGNSINYLYFTNNNLYGAVPDWILGSKQRFDLSYNSFNSSAPAYCYTGVVNLVSSYSSTDSNSISSCLRRNLPCSGKAKNYNLFINCGGDKMTIGNDEERLVEDTFATNVSVLNMSNPELYMTARLSPLSLRYYGLCLQNGNYTVKLHFAEIMFTDNQTFSSVGRRFFDVSIQKLLGAGKEKVKSFFAIVSDHTLEIHFQWVGKGTNAIPWRGIYGPLISAISVTPNFEPDLGESKLSTGAILGIVAAGCVVIILISIIIWFYLRRKNAEINELRRGLESQTGYFTLRQIKAATRNFDATNKIGEGGFGPVYKGVLPDGSVIAVKQLSSKSKQGNREFVNEIGMISALQHPNLVKLFGCCIEGNQLLLVYEYMENNSLASALFGRDRDRLKLNWQTRRSICLAIARGLAYLHEESRLKIVHRDIKATNVLLDKDLNAKISDFGLARLSEENETHISTRIAGTIGYMAPEYAMRGYLTDKADVYSFGVVTLEIVSGISNTNYRPKEECVYLLDWAYVLQERGNLLELVDKSLGSHFSEKEALQMLNLALSCTNPSPSLRPTMSVVVSILDGKNPVPMSYVKPMASNSDDARFKSFEKFSYDSQSPDISTDGPWIDSSVSLQSSYEENNTKRSS